MEITSRANDAVKYAVKLRESAAFRRENGQLLLEGARLCRDAAQSGIAVQTLYCTAAAQEKYAEYLTPLRDCAADCVRISESVSAALSETASPQGIFCLCALPGVNRAQWKQGGIYLALDAVQNPDNQGGILRSCEALGAAGVLLGGGCDLYHPKALRAAMGASLRLPVTITADLPALLRESPLPTLAAVPSAAARDIRRVDFSGGAVLVLGNEGNGISPAVLDACSAQVTIPMAGDAESLNVAAAAAMLLWEALR